ncbi:hypothetical protein KC946_00270 [Candidatus Saccharibacteria bacterium]|nr:hypothetical protein [Candidatus Saccharibacteria bacterium]
MSLTTDDLQDIRTIIKDEINPLRGDIEALSNDIKEIYEMISELQSSTITDKSFKKKSLEDKLLTVNAELLAMAKQAGITLPR